MCVRFNPHLLRLRQLSVVFLLSTLVASLSGCAQFERTSGVYQSDLGRAPTSDLLIRVVYDELQSFGFQIQDVSNNQLRTDWRERSPDASMELPGIARIRDLARVTYSTRGQSFATARMRMQFQIMQDGRWKAAEVPSSVKDEYQQIEDDVEQELERYMTQD